jgi:O-succinylbenzoate synthase
MKIVALDSFLYSLPLARPLPGASAGVLTREGMLIRLRSETGAEGRGDVAPLPGFSRESLAAAGDQLSALRPALLDRLPAFTQQPSWEAALLHPLAAWELFPSVRFGLECALCNLASAAWGSPWRVRLSAAALASVRINALLTGSRDEVLREAQVAVAQGYRSLKIKVGSAPVREDIDMVRQVSAVIPGHVTLRLDANRAWSLADALAFAQEIRDCAIEYIEEPVREAGTLEKYIRSSDLPVALDESLDAMDPGAPPQGLRAIVIKPTLRGGISSALRWARAARQAGVTPVISSAFESEVGLRALAELASVIHDPGVAAGLDTGRWMARGAAGPALQVIDGAVNVATLAGNTTRPEWPPRL